MNTEKRKTQSTMLTVLHKDGSKTVCKPMIEDGQGNRVFDGQWMRLANDIDPNYKNYIIS